MTMEFSEEWRNNKPLYVVSMRATLARENFYDIDEGLGVILFFSFLFLCFFFLYTYIVETL